MTELLQLTMNQTSEFDAVEDEAQTSEVVLIYNEWNDEDVIDLNGNKILVESIALDHDQDEWILADDSSQTTNSEAGARGKKRIANESLWSRTMIKNKKAKGLPHVSHNSRFVPQRVQSRPICRCQCWHKFTDEERVSILDCFNKLPDHSHQNQYLARCALPSVPRRRRPRKESKKKRKVTFTYAIEILRDSQTERIPVCKTAFLSLHGIKRSRLVHKVQNNRINVIDRRGKHLNRPKRLHPYVLRVVSEHIAAFPARESHYSRQKNQRKRYLDSSLSIAKMHRLFLQKYPSLSCVKYDTYRNVFNWKFNISFGFPRSDICEKCEELHAKLTAAKMNHDERLIKRIEAEKKLHQASGDAFYAQQREIVEAAKQNDDCAVIAMDFEKNLPLPLTGIGPEYYKRQLWLHNCCIKDMVSNRSVMYMYSENFARKGANESVSILLDYFKTLPESIETVHIFSDNCFAQNKNRFLWTVLQSLVLNGRFASIYLHYPIPGHSRLPCDRDFGLIEKSRRKIDRVVLPSEWVSLVRNVAKKTPFEVRFVSYPLTDDLLEDGTPVVLVRDYKSAVNEAIVKTVDNAQKLRGLWFSRIGIFARLTMNGQCDLPVKLLKRGKKWDSVRKAVGKSQRAYDDFLPIKTAKYNDIKYLLGRVSIPDSVSFYRSLKPAVNAKKKV